MKKFAFDLMGPRRNVDRNRLAFNHRTKVGKGRQNRPYIITAGAIDVIDSPTQTLALDGDGQ